MGSSKNITAGLLFQEARFNGEVFFKFAVYSFFQNLFEEKMKAPMKAKKYEKQ